MAMNFERLLKLTADYHNFCNDEFTKGNILSPSDELSMEELEFVAAAAMPPVEREEGKNT